jgi:CelD/BcsL family acetyltransferase involved in cellulose biosynthesis
VITEAGEFESLSGIWDSLLQRDGRDNSIYLTYEWISTWWRHFGEGKKLNILVVEKEQQIVGIIPLMKVEYRIGPFTLRTLESIGSVSNNHIGLTSPENEEEVVTAFLSYLKEELGKSRLVVKLDYVSGDSSLLAILRKQGSPFSPRLVFQEGVAALAPYLLLRGTWDEQYRLLSRNRRTAIKRALRSLEKDYRVVEFNECTAHNLDDMLTKLFDLHQRRWQSTGYNALRSDLRVREFYRDIAACFVHKGWLRLSCLTVDGELVSAVFGYTYRRRFYGVTIARDLRYSKYSIGHIHIMHLLKGAIAENMREFDFMRGVEPYKFYWTRIARRNMEVMLVKKDICSGLRLKCAHTFLRIYWIRQNGLRQSCSLYLAQRSRSKETNKMGFQTIG